MHPILETAWLFFRMGCTIFGGPLAHTAAFESEFVERRRWLEREGFLESLSLTQLIPGPNSTELAMHIGYARAGWLGFFLAGFCFLLPACVLTSLLAFFYLEGKNLPWMAGVLRGVAPVVVAVIAAAWIRVARSTYTEWRFCLLGLSSLALRFAGISDWMNLLLLAAAWLLQNKKWRAGFVFLLCALLPLLPISITSQGSAGIFFEMARIGAMVFGSGFVLYPLFEQRFVHELHWLNTETLNAAIAAGQSTPGPLFASASFVGQVLGGWQGAIAASVGIFAPAFLCSALAILIAKRLGQFPFWKIALRAFVAASLSLLAWQACLMLLALPREVLSFAILAASLLALIRYRVNPTWCLVAGALMGWLFSP